MLLFAEVDGWSAAIGGLIAALGAVLIPVLKSLLPYLKARGQEIEQSRQKTSQRDSRLRKEGFDAALDAYQNVIEQQREQSERQAQVIRDQQSAVDALQRAHTECREETAELRQVVYWLYDAAKRHAQALRESGRDPGDLPELPRIRERHEADFLARQAAQSAALAKEAAKTIPPVPPTTGALPTACEI